MNRHSIKFLFASKMHLEVGSKSIGIINQVYLEVLKFFKIVVV